MSNQKNPVMVLAGKKAARTRRLNELQREYDSAPNAGRKAAIRRQMNRLTNEPL